jgi:hypothetical protein
MSEKKYKERGKYDSVDMPLVPKNMVLVMPSPDGGRDIHFSFPAEGIIIPVPHVLSPPLSLFLFSTYIITRSPLFFIFNYNLDLSKLRSPAWRQAFYDDEKFTELMESINQLK